MKRFKRIIGIGLVAASLAVCCSCGGGDTGTSGGAVGDTGYNGVDNFKIAEEPTELTLFAITDTRLDDTAVWKKIEEITNIRIKTVSSSANSDVDTAMNTMLMSGDIPDLIFSTNMKKFANEYGPDGAFAAIDELAGEDTPNLNKQLERAVVSNYITHYDGHKYYMCNVNPDTVASGWIIRQDWLDKLGLDAPTTPDEFYEVMKAFKTQDPNGNGQADEVPYLSRFGAVDDLAYLFNASWSWCVDENGKVYYGPAQENYKTAYENIAKWYSEGLIDQEIYTRGTKSRDYLFGNNTGGITHDWFGSTMQFNDMLEETVPGFKLVAIAPPNEGHIEYTKREVPVDQGCAIGATSEKKELAIKLIDFLFSETGSRLMNFGIEGETYDLVDGKPVFKDFVVHGDKTAIQVLQELGACSMVYEQDFEYERQWLNKEALDGANLYIDNGYVVDETFPPLSYTEEEFERFNTIMTNVETFRNERCQQWVFGTADVASTFDDYVAELNRLGLEEATTIQQAAYDRYVSNSQ